MKPLEMLKKILDMCICLMYEMKLFMKIKEALVSGPACGLVGNLGQIARFVSWNSCKPLLENSYSLEDGPSLNSECEITHFCVFEASVCL